MKLFCIPHAGGSSIAYNVWTNYLHESIDFIPLDLPGHMPRSREPLCESLDEAVLDLAQSIEKKLKKDDLYAIYGHSMGGLLLYFLYFRLIMDGCNPPAHLFFSSRWPPYHCNEKAYINTDRWEEFRSRLIKMGGFNSEILHNEELLDYYIKILLADYHLIQSVKESRSQIIFSDMTVLWSYNEPDIFDEDIYKWKLSAGNRIAFVKIKGTHFFPTEDPEKTTEIINNTLRKYISISV